MIPRITIESHRDTHTILAALIAYQGTAEYVRLPADEKESADTLFRAVADIHEDKVSQDIASELEAALASIGAGPDEAQLLLGSGLAIQALSYDPATGKITVEDLSEFLR